MIEFLMRSFGLKSNEEGKDQESIQSNTTPDPGHHRESDENTRKYHIKEGQEVSPFPADDHNAAGNRQDIKADTKHK